MSTITLEEAQAGLADLILRLEPGEEVLITRGSQPVARLVSEAPPGRKGPRQTPEPDEQPVLRREAAGPYQDWAPRYSLLIGKAIEPTR